MLAPLVERSFAYVAERWVSEVVSQPGSFSRSGIEAAEGIDLVVVLAVLPREMLSQAAGDLRDLQGVGQSRVKE